MEVGVMEVGATEIEGSWLVEIVGNAASVLNSVIGSLGDSFGIGDCDGDNFEISVSKAGALGDGKIEGLGKNDSVMDENISPTSRGSDWKALVSADIAEMNVLIGDVKVRILLVVVRLKDFIFGNAGELAALLCVDVCRFGGGGRSDDAVRGGLNAGKIGAKEVDFNRN